MITVELNKEHYEIPMNAIKAISESPGFSDPVIGIDADYKVYLYFKEIDGLINLDSGLYRSVTGRGDTYRDACLDLLNQLLDTKYRIRTMSGGYKTEKIRKVILSFLNSID